MLEKNTNRIFDILKKNNIKITGAFHVGANKCEELVFYKELGLEPKDNLAIKIDNGIITLSKKITPLICSP